MIIGLFPTPIYSAHLRETTKEESSYIDEQLLDMVPNETNTTSRNINILDDAVMANLKSELESVVNAFGRHTLGIAPETDVKFYITYSWLNRTIKGGKHQEHPHPNSIFSGVYYPLAADDDAIVFNKYHSHWSKPDVFDFSTDYINEFSAHSYTQWINKGSLVLFPSSLRHRVEETDNDDRVSLAFNVWFKGEIGRFTNSLKV